MMFNGDFRRVFSSATSESRVASLAATGDIISNVSRAMWFDGLDMFTHVKNQTYPQVNLQKAIENGNL